MEYFFMILMIFIFAVAVGVLLGLLLLLRRKPKQKVVSEYDSEGYNRHGYNEAGRNRQGRYNRFYNVKCYRNGLYSEEGFLDIRRNPLYLTNHARARMKERMGISDSFKMDEVAFEAYQFGESKHQLMKSERGIVEEKEKEYTNSVILIYRGYCYVFSDNNGLITIYKNDRIRT